jgi:hypothetical protein
MRQILDLRRYASPVIVQNAEQVNIASDGGQQVSVQRRKPNKGRAKKKTSNAERGKTSGKRAGKVKPKQPAAKSPEEGITMKPALDIDLEKS